VVDLKTIPTAKASRTPGFLFSWRLDWRLGGSKLAVYKEEAALAVKIRLKRMGTNQKPFYRIVVADSRSPRDGRFIETLGYYNPLTEPSTIKVDEEKARLWLSRGAQPTDTVRDILVRQGLLERPERQPAAPEAAQESEP